MHQFATQRLFIRPFIDTDEAFYCQLYQDKKVMRNITQSLSPAESKKHFSNALKAIKRQKKTVLNWAIVEKASERLIGFQALSWLPPSQATKPSTKALNQVEIGIMLATKANGKNYPEEAMGALVEYAFSYLNIDRINAFYTNKNLATKRFVKKLGFIYEAELQDSDSNNSYQYIDKAQWDKNVITTAPTRLK